MDFLPDIPLVYHQEVFVFIWITTRRFLFLFESPSGAFCFYLNFNQFHALRFDEFFSLVENKIVKIKRKKWSKLSFFISKLLRMPLPGSWKTGNGSANHSYSYGHDLCPTGTRHDHNCTCGWQNPFPVFQLPGKDTFNSDDIQFLIPNQKDDYVGLFSEFDLGQYNSLKNHLYLKLWQMSRSFTHWYFLRLCLYKVWW